MSTSTPTPIDLTLRSPSSSSSSTSSTPRRKPTPQRSAIGVPFEYTPSADGTDENLLVLLHGLGDTHAPFARLGRSLNLPQTATLAIRAPEQIPYLDEPAFQWYPSFTPLGELIEPSSPLLDPSSAITLLIRILSHLTDGCKWPENRIHLFGFGQGGSVGAEAGLQFWRDSQPQRDGEMENQNQKRGTLGSIVTISGPLLSFPTTIPSSARSPTPVLFVSRSSSSSSELGALRKGFSDVRDVRLGRGEGMPRSREEWEPVMRFWSERLGRRVAGVGGDEGVYEVVGGGVPGVAR